MANNSFTSEAGPNPVVYSVSAVTRVIALLFLLMVTNFNFTIYHLYMRKKPEFSNRLLNVLYSFHASLLQFGSFIILLIFCYKSTDGYYGILKKKFLPSLEVFIMMRMFHLCCVFVNIFFIGMANLIQNFRMDLYLLISVKITRKIVCATIFCISIITNIFVKLSIKEEENDGELGSHQILMKRVCTCLNMMALAMCLIVIVRSLIFCLKKQFFIFLEHARKYFLQQQVAVTPIVTIEMEMSQFEVNTDALEPFNTNSNSNIVNPTIYVEEYIRLVLLNDGLICVLPFS